MFPNISDCPEPALGIPDTLPPHQIEAAAPLAVYLDCSIDWPLTK